MSLIKRCALAFLFLALSLQVKAQSPTVTSVVGGCSCTLFNNVAPARLVSGPDSSLELGTKFYSETNGYVTDLRFYKMPNETGTQVGTLWDGNGNQLARVTFTNETPSGWQRQPLLVPVAIVANATYVVSYHTSNGFYAWDTSYFSVMYTNGTLHVPASGGVYIYGTSRFPTTSTQTNYYADVVFDNHYVTLSWNAVPGQAVYYNVYRSQTPGAYNMGAPLASMLSVPTYNDTTVVSGQTYYWVVTTVNQSAPSAEVSSVVP